MNIFKKYFTDLLILASVLLASYNIFNFSYITIPEKICSSPILPRLPNLSECESVSGVAYFYPVNTLILISIGIGLIVLGILIKSKKYGSK